MSKNEKKKTNNQTNKQRNSINRVLNEWRTPNTYSTTQSGQTLSFNGWTETDNRMKATVIFNFTFFFVSFDSTTSSYLTDGSTQNLAVHIVLFQVVSSHTTQFHAYTQIYDAFMCMRHLLRHTLCVRNGFFFSLFLNLKLYFPIRLTDVVCDVLETHIHTYVYVRIHTWVFRFVSFVLFSSIDGKTVYIHDCG